MCKVAHVIHYIVLSQNFHFCCFRAMAYIWPWNSVQSCLFSQRSEVEQLLLVSDMLATWMYIVMYWAMSAGNRGKLSRLLRQFTPYVWTEFDWRPTSSLTRWFSMLMIIAMVSCSLSMWFCLHHCEIEWECCVLLLLYLSQNCWFTNMMSEIANYHVEYVWISFVWSKELYKVMERYFCSESSDSELHITGEILWSWVSMHVFLIGIQCALCLLVAVLSGWVEHFYTEVCTVDPSATLPLPWSSCVLAILGCSHHAWNIPVPWRPVSICQQDGFESLCFKNKFLGLPMVLFFLMIFRSYKM